MQNLEIPAPLNRFEGEHTVIELGDEAYPEALARMENPPERLFVVGDPKALEEGIAIAGARRATPYGLECARRFAALTAQRGVTVVSGGALGIGAAVMETALKHGGRAVAFLGGGLAKDTVYPQANADLFQKVIGGGGALVSAVPWGFPPRPYLFRERNRWIAYLAKAVLVVEAGLPSGTFSLADYALEASRDVLAVPGNIDAPASKGCNFLIAQGATPIVDDASYLGALSALFG